MPQKSETKLQESRQKGSSSPSKTGTIACWFRGISDDSKSATDSSITLFVFGDGREVSMIQNISGDCRTRTRAESKQRYIERAFSPFESNLLQKISVVIVTVENLVSAWAQWYSRRNLSLIIIMGLCTGFWWVSQLPVNYFSSFPSCASSSSSWSSRRSSFSSS